MTRTTLRSGLLRSSALGLTLAALLLPRAADAQPSVDEFSVVRFTPAPGPGNYLATDGTLVAGHLVPSFGLVADYAHNPFVLYDAFCDFEDPTNCDVSGTNTKLVKYTAVGHFLATLGLFDAAQIGLSFPLAYMDSDRFAYRDPVSGTVVSVGGDSKLGVADPRLHLKVRLLGDGVHGFGLAGSGYVSIPLGKAVAEGAYLGESTVTGGAQVIASYRAAGFHLVGNLGGVLRPTQELFSTSVGSGLTYNAVVGYDLTELFLVFAEAQGLTSFSPETDENPLETRLAASLRQGDFSFTLGGGVGVLAGVGVPAFRLIGGIQYAPVRSDADGDGVLDEADACPADAEDRDGYQDEDGCPEGDNDSDGRADGDDPCPNEPEDRDGYKDDDGCPDTDNDGDGIPDGYDSCPDAAEDKDGDRDDDGCPDDDTDKDGIRDALDKCPTEPEDTDGFGDDDGCPETDFDSDGIADDQDECPDQPEIINGVKDKDGCPEQDQDGDGIPDDVDQCPTEAETLNGFKDDDGCADGEPLVRVEGKQIVLLEQVRFRTNSASIVGKESKALLDAVATILRRNPGYARIRVEGHTDATGDAAKNRKLSEGRAQACINALVKKGIARDRLHAQGHGPDKPLATNDTEEGRTANRRVEFHIEDAQSK